MDRSLPIVAAQVAPVAWDPARTLEAYESYVTGIARSVPSTRLVIHPELHLTGLGAFEQTPPPAWTPRALAQPIPGPLTERLGRLALDLGLWLIPGSIYELAEDGAVYNSAVAIGPDGTLRARYRKAFPWRPYEDVAAGQEFVAFDMDGIGRAGLMVCYDGWFPEVSRQLAWLGAEVIFQPSATGTTDRAQEVVLAQANAIVNQVFVVNVNASAPAGRGASAIVDPEGRPIRIAGEADEAITAVLDLAHVDRARRIGTAGLNRLWKQLDEEGDRLELPMYGGRLRARRVEDEPARRG